MAGQPITDLASQERPMHPGELFKREVLPALELSISEAANRLRVSRQTLHRMIAGTHAVTPEMALRLGRFCGSGPYLWLRMQQNYDLWNVAHDSRVEVEIELIPTSPGIGDFPSLTTTRPTETGMIAGKEQSEDEIGRLYDEIADLTEKLNDQAGLERGLIEAQIDAAYVELRQLQVQEAESFRRAFEGSLELPLGEGSRTLREARGLISALEQIVGTGSGEDQTKVGVEAPAAPKAPAVPEAPAL